MDQRIKKWILRILQMIAALILLQTLFFKFTGAPESKFIFSTLGIEPWGRWFAGISELLASVLLLIPGTQLLGAILSIGIMIGAIASHLLILGIVVQDDGGLLFALAMAVLLINIVIVYLRQNEKAIWIARGKQWFQTNSLEK